MYVDVKTAIEWRAVTPGVFRLQKIWRRQLAPTLPLESGTRALFPFEYIVVACIPIVVLIFLFWRIKVVRQTHYVTLRSVFLSRSLSYPKLSIVPARVNPARSAIGTHMSQRHGTVSSTIGPGGRRTGNRDIDDNLGEEREEELPAYLSKDGKLPDYWIPSLGYEDRTVVSSVAPVRPPEQAHLPA